MDDVSTAYRHPLLAGYSPVPLVQPSLLRTQQCFPRRADVTDAAAQQASFHVHSRWALVSAGGSGSAWHIDPWNTSAWNALLSGRKRWALYPPGVAGLPAGVAASSPRAFFGRVLGSLPPEERPQQCVLREGETMFVPSGWWHAVLNLSPTIAITENRVDGANLAAVLEEMRAADPASESGRRAATACRRLMEGQADRGEYPPATARSASTRTPSAMPTWRIACAGSRHAVEHDGSPPVGSRPRLRGGCNQRTAAELLPIKGSPHVVL